ncbi:MAG: hypothetical protein HY060_12560 [Proteobacteria bacterium]|nr:hypothetical protein [Pseudomonadota bacterium]
MTIIGLVVRALRGWIASAETGEEGDALGACPGGAYSVFYIDAGRPNEIQMRGAVADRCQLWIEPSDVRPGSRGTELLVDVTIAHRRDGKPALTEFQIALTEDLKPQVH